jgi:hypothetical protein
MPIRQFNEKKPFGGGCAVVVLSKTGDYLELCVMNKKHKMEWKKGSEVVGGRVIFCTKQ